MQLYTLTSSFLPRDLVSDFVSAIWTERYSAAGDVQIVAPATPDMIDLLSQGTFLGLRGVKEIMILDTQSIENGLLTVTGQSLPKFLDERQAWFKETDSSTEELVGDYIATTTAGQLISSAVDKTVITVAPFGAGFTSVDLDWARDKIQGLELALIDANGTPRRLTIGKGPLYTAIQQLAAAEGVGFKLYLKSSSRSGGYILRFSTYRGKNRTSEQEVHQMVRFTPQMDSLSDVKEVASISTYKNVIYVKYKNVISKHYAEPTLPIPEGFDRRVLLVEAEDIYLVPDRITEYREQTARDAIANHIYVKAVDGQTSPQNNYKFNVDYGLGDVIELEGFTGLISKARVTEYIRSQDQFGDKEYPTLSVIDPLNTGFMPDLEPNEDWEDDWNEDPDFDLDDDFDDWDDEDFDDFDTKRRRKRKPKPTAPDPELNPVPEDPNPDPTPDEDDYPYPDPDHPGPHIHAHQELNNWTLDHIFIGNAYDRKRWYYKQYMPNPILDPKSHNHVFHMKAAIPLYTRMIDPFTGSGSNGNNVGDFAGLNGELLSFQVGSFVQMINIQDTRATEEWYWHRPPDINMMPYDDWPHNPFPPGDPFLDPPANSGDLATLVKRWVIELTVNVPPLTFIEEDNPNVAPVWYCQWEEGPMLSDPEDYRWSSWRWHWFKDLSDIQVNPPPTFFEYDWIYHAPST